MYIAKTINCHSNINSCIIIVNCGDPTSPNNGTIRNYTNTREGVQVIFQCNDGFRPSQPMTSNCTNTTEWVPNPGMHICTLVTG